MASRKKKFNIIDAVAAVALLALAAFAVTALMPGIGKDKGSVKIRYVLETDMLSSEFTSKAAVGDGVYTVDKAEQLGTVSAVSSSPARHTGTDSEGRAVISEIDGFSVLYITVEADAEQTKTGYAIGASEINVGRDYTLRLPSLYCSAHCVSVEIPED